MCSFIDFEADVDGESSVGESSADYERSDVDSYSSDLETNRSPTRDNPRVKRRRRSLHQEGSGSTELLDEIKKVKELLEELVKRVQKTEERVQSLEERMSGGRARVSKCRRTRNADVPNEVRVSE